MRTFTTLIALLSATAAACTDSASDPMEQTEPGSIALQLASDNARIIRGTSTSIAVIVASDAAGDVTVSVDDLPSGVTASPIVIPAGQSAGTITLIASADIPMGSYATATVRASADDGATADAPLDLHLTDAPGALDVSFGPGGGVANTFTDGNGGAYSVVRQPSGKLVVALASIKSSHYVVVRYDEQGGVDSTFGTDGKIDLPSGALDVPTLVQRADGTLLLGTRTTSDTAVYAFTADGKYLDGYGNAYHAASIAPNTVGVSFPFHGMAARADGGAYVVGIDGTKTIRVASITPAGQIDTTFDGDGVASITLPSDTYSGSIALASDGGVIIATQDGSNLQLAKLTATGGLDASFAGTGQKSIVSNGAPTASLALADGRLAVATFTGAQAEVLMVAPDGSVTHGTPTTRAGFLSMVEADGSIYGIGATLPVDTAQLGIAKFRLDGTLDATFADGGVARVTPISGGQQTIGAGAVADADGRLVIVGMSQNQGIGDAFVARVWR